MKKIKVAALILALVLSAPTWAMSEAMEALIKTSVETVGKELLNRYINSKKEANQATAATTTTATPAAITTSTPTDTTTTTSTTTTSQTDDVIIIQ